MMSNKMESKTLRIVYEKYFKSLVLCSLSYTHRADISEDIVQEVIINFFEKERISNIKGTIQSYLKGAVIKASLKYIRDNSRFVFEEIEQTAAEEISACVNDDNEEKTISKLLSTIETLPPRSREILNMIIYENKKHSQVATDLKISVNSVKSQYYSALDRLKDKIYLFIF